MKKLLLSCTFEEAVEHAEALTGELCASDIWKDTAERAQEMGLSLSVSFRHTFSPDAKPTYIPLSSMTGKLPFGYALSLWVDLVADKRIVAYRTEDGDVIQCSFEAIAVEAQAGLFVSHALFRTLAELLDDSRLIETVEEALDAIEEDGWYATPFRENALISADPMGECGLVRSVGDVGEGAYVELSPTPYDGSVGGARSVFFRPDAFLPYRLLLIGLIGEAAEEEPSFTLTRDETAALADALDDLPHDMGRVGSFSDILAASYGLFSYAPPPRADSLINTLTYLRREDFLSDLSYLSSLLREWLAAGDTLTVIL